MLKIADKNDLHKGLHGITHESRSGAIKAIKEVTDKGITVYTGIKKHKNYQIGDPKLGGPRLYSGEVVVYGINTTEGELVFSGMIEDIIKTKVSRGTDRGEQLNKLGVQDQWLLIVKRLGIPDLYDIVDQYGVGAQIKFIMDALTGEAHEIRGSLLPFEDLVESLSNGCLDADQIVKEIVGRVLVYNKDLTKALEESDGYPPKYWH
jgi:hypothetical protein